MLLSEKLNKSLTNQTPSPEQVSRIETVRAAARMFGEAIETQSKPSREQALAITKIEESVMWAVKGILLNP